MRHHRLLKIRKLVALEHGNLPAAEKRLSTSLDGITMVRACDPFNGRAVLSRGNGGPPVSSHLQRTYGKMSPFGLPRPLPVLDSPSRGIHLSMQEDLHHRVRLRFGVFELDLRAGELRKHGLRIHIQEQPFQVLVLLLEQAGEVVTREELQKKLWLADTFVDFDHGLNKAISKIREALSDSVESPRFVETVARRGYRFLAEVNIADGASRRIADSPVGSVDATETRDRRGDGRETKAASGFLSPPARKLAFIALLLILTFL